MFEYPTIYADYDLCPDLPARPVMLYESESEEALRRRRTRLRAVVKTLFTWAAVLLVGTGGAGFWYLGYHVHQVPWCHAAGWVAIGLGCGAGILATTRRD